MKKSILMIAIVLTGCFPSADMNERKEQLKNDSILVNWMGEHYGDSVKVKVEMETRRLNKFKRKHFWND